MKLGEQILYQQLFCQQSFLKHVTDNSLKFDPSFDNTLHNFGKKYKDNLMVIFDQWLKLQYLGLNVEAKIQFLNGTYLTKGSSETLTDEQARNEEELEDVLGPEVNDNDFGLESKFRSRLIKI